MLLTTIKWIFIAVCFVISIAIGVAPIHLKQCTGNEKILGLANSFSGGVFFTIALVHILPECANLYYSDKLSNVLDNQIIPYYGLTDVQKQEIITAYT